MRILVVAPSDVKSRGGMATVVKGMRHSKILNTNLLLDIHSSYIDGNIFVRLWYSVYGYIKFLFKYKKYDLFHIHVASFGSTFRKNYYLNKIKKAGKKVILHVHGAKYLVFYEGLSKKNKDKVVEFLKRADKVIVLSDTWKEKFEEVFGINNCEAINNGIDVDEFDDAICDLSKYKNTFLFLGRLGERKGAYDLIEAVSRAVKKNNKIKVLMAGDGEIEKVKELVSKNELENNIEVVGWINHDKKVELLRQTATVVLPSYYEGLPMTILEGMAAGKAIISTNVGAIPEVVSPENGILITPGNIDALTEALVKCSEDDEMIGKMGICNIKKIDECFSMKKMHEQIKCIYYSVMEAQ